MADSLDTGVLVWRIPPYQPALLMLLVCASAALNIYTSPSAQVRIPTIALGLAALGCAVFALRAHLMADDRGISVRGFGRQVWLPWPELHNFEIVDGVRGASTVRLNRTDGGYVDVPPSLLQPSRPTAKRQALAQLDVVVRQLNTLRPRQR